MIKVIGIENFRVFKDYTKFKLAPITVLTGTNNSGKSSFLKLLDLLKSNFSTIRNFDELNFESGNHNLGTFDKVLNWDNDMKEFKIIFELNLDYFDEEFQLELSYELSNEKGKIKSFKIFNEKRVLFLLDNIMFQFDSIDNVIDIDYLKKSHNQNTICKEEINYSSKIIKHFKEYNENVPFKKLTEKERELQIFSNVFSTGEALQDPDRIPNTISLEDFTKQFYKKEYDVLANKEFSLYYINKKEWLKSDFDEKTLEKLIVESEKLFFNSVNEGANFFRCELQDDQNNIINRIFIENKFTFDDFDYQFNFALPQNDIFFKSKDKGGSFLFDIEEDLFEELFFFKKEQIENFDKYFVKNIGRALKDIQRSFESINIISATRGSKNRILGNKSVNDIDATVKQFKQTELNKQDISFIDSSLCLLDIKGEIEIERIEGVASVVYLKQENRKVSLSDLGYGYSQVIPIILKIILVNKKNEGLSLSEFLDYKNSSKKREVFNSTIIIEEPEANLHPNLQSKLADVLVLAHKTFGLHFILESHSEYLIRKLQYLTAKKEIAQNDVLIYYFNADEYVTEKELKVKEIQIDEFGALTDSFGPGFFDEATNLKFELIKLNQAQNN